MEKGGAPCYEATPLLCFKCEKLGTILEKKNKNKNKKYL